MVARILADAALQPHRQKMYLTSQDDEFRTKRDDVLHLYYDTPAAEHIICLDEKTSMQALERRHPDVPMAPDQPVRREVEYVRHGTMCFMGAYDVRARKLFGFVAPKRGGEPFVALLNQVDSAYPCGRGHLVCDNLSDHNTDDVQRPRILRLRRRSPQRDLRLLALVQRAERPSLSVDLQAEVVVITHGWTSAGRH